MGQTLGERTMLTLLPLMLRPLARATLLLGLLSLLSTPLLVPPQSGPISPLVLPGTPMAVAVDDATHDLVLATKADDTVLAMDGPGASLLGDVPFPNGYPKAMAVDPIAGYVYVADTQDQIVVFGSPFSTPVATIDLGQPPVALAVNPTTGRVYVATLLVEHDKSSAYLVVLDGPHDNVLAKLALSPGYLRIAIDATSDRVYVTDDGSNTLTVLDGATNEILGTLPIGRGQHELAVDSRTGRVYISNDADDSLAVLDGPRLRPLDTLNLAGSPGAIGVNERMDRVYIATDRGDVAVLDGQTDRLLTSMPVDRHPSGLAVDSATNRVYVTDPIDGTVWLLQDGRFRHPSVRLIAFAGGTGGPTDQKHEECGC